MKQIKVQFNLNIGYSRAEHKEIVEFEFEDNTTEEDIEIELGEYWLEWSNNFIDGGWNIVEEE